MRRLILVGIAAAALVLAAQAGSAPTAITTVQITRQAFVPKTVTINANDSITWHNADTINHQVVANGGQFASPVLAPGKSYTHQFTRGATIHYHDALHPTLKGTLVVKGPPPQVTLASSVPVVKFGGAVTLTGAVSNQKAGETVTLVQLPIGQTTKQVVATLQTGAGGTFSFSVTPQIYTTYQAQWKGLESSVIVQVQPLIKLPTPSHGYFHFYVKAATSFAGRVVFLQRLSLAEHRYLSYRKLVLGARSGKIFPVSYAPRHARTNIRVYLPQDQAGTGYLQTWSGSQPVRRR